MSARTTGDQSVRPVLLIVDDEASIRKSLEGIFSDEGFIAKSVNNGAAALAEIENHRPAVVLLDIWMPGMDGLEVLGRIKQRDPSLPVIMISGHATIATAVRATHLGAVDFIEKPLDLDATLSAVRKALGTVQACLDSKQAANAGMDAGDGSFDIGDSIHQSDPDPIVFASQTLRGRKIRQRTLAQTGLLYGQGLHSGRKSGLILEPLPPNSGIHFCGVSQQAIVPAHVDFVGNTGFATTLRLGDTQAGTTEHLMAALHAYGISNLLIKCNGEVPVMDGSAREFCALFETVGMEEQDGDWYEIEIRRTIAVDKGKESIRIEPADNFEVDYTLEYPSPLGTQRYVYRAGDPDLFKREVAPARTFGLVKDISNLQKAGLALGGRFDNFVLIGEKGPINDALRFNDEPVRHKVLDAVGDLYLLGRPLKGRVVAKMTGHSENISLLRLIREELSRAGI